NQAAVELYLGKTLKNGEAMLLNDLIAAVSAFISNHTGRNWLGVGKNESTVIPESRVYDGSGTRELAVDDMLSVTKVEILDYLGTPYYEIPLPEITLLDSKDIIFSRLNRFPCGILNIKVTGKFSSGALPDPVKYVATQLVAHKIQ